MADEEKSAVTPEAFLSALGNDLKGTNGVDTDLLEILRTYILKESPAQNAVTMAKDAILKLAAERAHPSELANG
jgi:hypothetical protein